MDLGITGRTAVVCASSRGLGKACAEALAGAGVNLVLTARSEGPLDETAADLRNRFVVDVTTVAADVTPDAGRQAIVAAWSGADLLINTPGVPPPGHCRRFVLVSWPPAFD